MPRGTNWNDARDLWLALDPPRSYETIARQFGVSGTRVRYVARRDNWAADADRIDAEAARRRDKRIVKTREQRVEAFLRITDKAFDAALGKLEAGQLEVRLGDLPALGKHAELLVGEATDRMSFAEVQEALTTVLRIAARHVPRGARGEFLREVNEALGVIADAAEEGEAA